MTQNIAPQLKRNQGGHHFKLDLVSYVDKNSNVGLKQTFVYLCRLFLIKVWVQIAHNFEAMWYVYDLSDSSTSYKIIALMFTKRSVFLDKV